MMTPLETEPTAAPVVDDLPFEPFEPHLLLWNGHMQTLAAAWLGDNRAPSPSSDEHRIQLADGDQLVIHDNQPADWQPTGPATVLLHGLCGSATSAYMARIADKLNQRGQRTFRVDMRGCGAGQDLAKRPYHAGRSDDLAAAVAYVRDLCPASPLHAVGFSLGGNILLKWLGEQHEASSGPVTRAIAVNPPIDLQRCTDHLTTACRGFYDRHFAKLLFQHVRETHHWRIQLPAAWSARRPRRLLEFDELFTAPRAGFASAADYYHHCSAARVIERINVPTLILSSRDDPLVPVGTLENQDWPECVRLHFAPRGGHLGYIGRSSSNDPDRNWMDWRVVDWLTSGGPA